MTLTEALQACLGDLLKAAKLELDAAPAALLARLRKRTPGLLSKRKRVGLVVLRWAELEGPVFDAALDGPVGEGFAQLDTAKDVRALLGPALALLAPLPEARREPLVARLVDQATRACLLGPAPWDIEALRPARGEASALIQGLLEARERGSLTTWQALRGYAQQERAPQGATAVGWTAVPTTALVWALGRLDPSAGLALACFPLLKAELRECCRDELPSWRVGSPDVVREVLARLPPERRAEALDATWSVEQWIDLIAERRVPEPWIHDLRVQEVHPGQLESVGAVLRRFEDVREVLRRLLMERQGASVARFWLGSSPPPSAEELVQVGAVLAPRREAASLLSWHASALPAEALGAAVEAAWSGADQAGRVGLADLLAVHAARSGAAVLPVVERLRSLEGEGEEVLAALDAARHNASHVAADFCGRLSDWLGGSWVLTPPDAGFEELSRSRSYYHPTIVLDQHGRETVALALSRRVEGPVLAWSAILKLGPDRRAAHARFFMEWFEDEVMLAVLEGILQAPSAPVVLAWAYQWLLDAHPGRLGVDFHLGMLASGKTTFQDIAVITLLSARDEGLMPRLSALLTHKKAPVRLAATRCLERRGDASALDALRAALAAEPKAEVREAMQAAINELDPRRVGVRSFDADYGAWRGADGLDAQELLARLRGLIPEAPSRVGWMHRCDLLGRLRLVGAAEVGIQYLLGHGLEGFAAEELVIPWGWDRMEGFAPLLEAVRGRGVPAASEAPWLVSVATLYDPLWALLVKEQVPRFELRTKVRLYQDDLTTTFLDAVSWAWSWCERNHVPLEHLEVRADAGSVSRFNIYGQPSSSGMELVDGFGVRFGRLRAVHEDNAQGPGLRRIRVTLPTRHPARDVWGVGPRQRLLDLTAMPDAPPEAGGAPSADI